MVVSRVSWLARSLAGTTPWGPRTGEGGGSGDQEGSRPRGLRECHAGGWSSGITCAGEGSDRRPCGGHEPWACPHIRVVASSHTGGSEGCGMVWAITDWRLEALLSGGLDA